ncbi:AAA family ATPase, partial [Candidatus Poribacteria bacterium]|nr:AAA family ATPase [Candidatus Poribacteria bacterium]
MKISKIRVKNFKSFRDMEIELGDLSVLIGANASGKSNFVQLFKFLRDIQQFGLDDAISRQGGIEYLMNTRGENKQILFIEISADQNLAFYTELDRRTFRVQIKQVTYYFKISFSKQTYLHEIIEDKIIYKCDFMEVKEKNEKDKSTISGEITISNKKGKLHFNIEPKRMYPEAISPSNIYSERRLLLETLYFFIDNIILILFRKPLDFKEKDDIGLEMAISGFKSISIYDFDPKISKKAMSINVPGKLSEDGDNLTTVLKNILRDEEEKRKLYNLVDYLL